MKKVERKSLAEDVRALADSYDEFPDFDWEELKDMIREAGLEPTDFERY